LNQVPCRAGCSGCCNGVFPITRLDVRLLQEGLGRLPADQRKRIEERAAHQTAALEATYPQLEMSPSLDVWSDEAIDHAVHAYRDAPCPALGKDGLCALYAYRPLTCRSMGIPTRQDATVNGACPVQTFVPVVRLSASLETEEQELATAEAALLEGLPEVAAEGEEILLPYAFVSRRLKPALHKPSPAAKKRASTCEVPSDEASRRSLLASGERNDGATLDSRHR
jgi:Fe-S-cluster containining protein